MVKLRTDKDLVLQAVQDNPGIDVETIIHQTKVSKSPLGRILLDLVDKEIVSRTKHNRRWHYRMV